MHIGVVCKTSHILEYVFSKVSIECIDPYSRILVASAYTFDIHQGDVLSALSAGARAVFIRPRGTLLTALDECIKLTRPTHMCCTPALWGTMPTDKDCEIYTRFECSFISLVLNVVLFHSF
jgi:hypothetical protein